MIIDYTKENGITFWKLEELEVERQGSKDRRLRNVKIRLLCDCCRKPFVKWLHDPSMAFSFCCSEKCLKQEEAEVHKKLRGEGTGK
jgi:hypothetical protein